MDDSLYFFPYYMQTPSKQRILSKFGTPRRTSLDHCYSRTPKDSSTSQTTQVRKLNLQSTPSQQDSVHDMAGNAEENSWCNDPLDSSMESVVEHSDNDSDFIPSGTDLLSDSCASDSDSSDEKIEGLEQQPKYIIFKDNLEMLFKFCQICGAVVITKVPKTTGSLVSYTISCHEGHEYVWESQPTISQKPLGNALISAAILTTGNTYGKISDFANAMNLKIISSTVYDEYQKKTVIPVIQETWSEERGKLVEEFKEKSLVLAGDARCDSPGHGAKYGSYTLMHIDGNGEQGSRKIVSMKLVAEFEVKNSHHLEPEGLRRCLDQVLKEDELQVSVLATDRHRMVGAMMKKDFTDIHHQFDIWHFAKSIIKKLTAKANTYTV
jgi:hypothetical protein